MSDDKPEVRNVPVFYIEVGKDCDAVTSRGEYRAMLDFRLPFNGKKPRVFRMRISPAEIAYLRERLDRAEAIIREKFESSFK